MKKKITRYLIAAISAVYTASFATMTAFAEEAGDAADNAANKQQGSMMTFVVPFIIMIVLFYFMLIRPQKKREQEMKDLQSSIQVGDEVVTNGGIVGMVVRTGEDTVVIETGGERNKIRIKSWAIAENVSAKERANEAAGKDKAKNPLAAAGLSEDPSAKKKKKKKSDEDDED